MGSGPSVLSGAGRGCHVVFGLEPASDAARAAIALPTMLRKYPRTPHLQGSRLQPGDEDLDAVPFAAVRGRRLVVEEKIDGANAALSFDERGTLRLQSRGHFLTGGPRERHFAMLKTWASAIQAPLHARIGARYVVYGEWLHAKHTVFYDRLPHYFLEFDVLDRETGAFLSTERRHTLLAGTGIVPVPVVADRAFDRLAELAACLAPSLYQGPTWRESLRDAIAEVPHADPARTLAETDDEDLAEGLYVKREEGGEVVGRYKYVRASFLTRILQADSHWLTRPIVHNRLAPGADLYGGAA